MAPNAPFPGNADDITPVELAAEFPEYAHEARPGKVVRDWLRQEVRERLPSKRHEWRIPPQMADQIRAFLREKIARRR